MALLSLFHQHRWILLFLIRKVIPAHGKKTQITWKMIHSPFFLAPPPISTPQKPPRPLIFMCRPRVLYAYTHVLFKWDQLYLLLCIFLTSLLAFYHGHISILTHLVSCHKKAKKSMHSVLSDGCTVIYLITSFWMESKHLQEHGCLRMLGRASERRWHFIAGFEEWVGVCELNCLCWWQWYGGKSRRMGRGIRGTRWIQEGTRAGSHAPFCLEGLPERASPAIGEGARASPVEGRCQAGSGDLSMVSCESGGRQSTCKWLNIWAKQPSVSAKKKKERRKNPLRLLVTPVIAQEMLHSSNAWWHVNPWRKPGLAGPVF